MLTYYELDRRADAWGSFGSVLTCGFPYGGDDERLQLMRTGPFVPPISFPPSTTVVTEAFRTRLEASGLGGIEEYLPVIKHKIVKLHWEKWDGKKDLEPWQLPAESPEGYILRRRHSPEIANAMEALWELRARRLVVEWLTPRRSVDNIDRGYRNPDVIRIRGASVWNLDFFSVGDSTSLNVSQRAKEWLEHAVGEWVSFFPIFVEAFSGDDPDSGAQATRCLLDYVEHRGEQSGELKGLEVGQRTLLREQLECRFGPLSPTTQGRLANWPAERLTELGRSLLSASSLEQLGLDA